MSRRRIPVSPEIVDDCRRCDAACCRANMIVALTLKEHAFMTKAGNRFHTVVPIAPFDRNNALYPNGFNQDPITGEVAKLLFEPGRETEPLAANFGRFILLNDCKYLEVTETGRAHCGAYEERPGFCQDFEMGGDKCHLMQIVNRPQL